MIIKITIAYLSFFFIEFIAAAWETLHWNEEISESALELVPVIAVVE